MAAFQELISGLRRAERHLEKQLAGIRDAISSLELGGGGVPRLARRVPRRGPGRPRKRVLSAKARAAISRAQKARWAKARARSKKAAT